MSRNTQLGLSCSRGRFGKNASAEPPITNAIGYGNSKRLATTAIATIAVRRTKSSQDSFIGSVLHEPSTLTLGCSDRVPKRERRAGSHRRHRRRRVEARKTCRNPPP